MASTYLSKTFASSGNRQRQTISVWVKRGNLGTGQNIFSVYYTASIWGNFYFNSSDQLKYYNNGGAYDLTTNRKFRDTNAWYHIVLELNTTEATASDRIKLWVNGVQETSFASTTYPTLNAEVTFGDNYSHYIGTYNAGTDNFSGSMSHFHFITNTAYDATAFGQYDANGVWTIKTSPSVTYGTNGFFILKDGNSVTDQSGNGNNFTVASGTLTNTEDNPSNVFATINPLNSSETSSTFFFTSLGNTELTATDNDSTRQMGITINPENMKGYFEMKVAVDNNWQIHVQDITRRLTKTPYDNSSNPTYRYTNNGSISYGTGTWTNLIASYTSAASTGDIIGVAFDFTGSNKNVWFHLNGTYGNNGSGVGNPATGDYPALTASNLNTADHYAFLFSVNTGGSDSSVQANFGNGYFGTTAVASAGTNASGNGIFEYDVPTGYTALCTKGLNGE